MTDTEALRRALDDLSVLDDPSFDDYTIELNSNDALTIKDAARRWLALAEGDEVVVEKGATAAYGLDHTPWNDPVWDEVDEPQKDYFRRSVRAVLAAITEGE